MKVPQSIKKITILLFLLFIEAVIFPSKINAGSFLINEFYIKMPNGQSEPLPGVNMHSIYKEGLEHWDDKEFIIQDDACDYTLLGESKFKVLEDVGAGVDTVAKNKCGVFTACDSVGLTAPYFTQEYDSEISYANPQSTKYDRIYNTPYGTITRLTYNSEKDNYDFEKYLETSFQTFYPNDSDYLSFSKSKKFGNIFNFEKGNPRGTNTSSWSVSIEGNAQDGTPMSSHVSVIDKVLTKDNIDSTLGTSIGKIYRNALCGDPECTKLTDPGDMGYVGDCEDIKEIKCGEECYTGSTRKIRGTEYKVKCGATFWDKWSHLYNFDGYEPWDSKEISWKANEAVRVNPGGNQLLKTVKWTFEDTNQKTTSASGQTYCLAADGTKVPIANVDVKVDDDYDNYCLEDNSITNAEACKAAKHQWIARPHTTKTGTTGIFTINELPYWNNGLLIDVSITSLDNVANTTTYNGKTYDTSKLSISKTICDKTGTTAGATGCTIPTNYPNTTACGNNSVGDTINDSYEWCSTTTLTALSNFNFELTNCPEIVEEIPNAGCTSKSVNKIAANPGDQIDFTITFFNGAVEATTAKPITITDTLPTGLTYQSAIFGAGVTGTCSAAGQELTCTLTSVPADVNGKTIVIKTLASSTLAQGTVISNTAKVSINGDSNTADTNCSVKTPACLETSPRSINIRVADLASKSQELTTIADIGTYTDVEFKWIASAGTLSNSQWHDSSGTPADGKVTDAITWTAPATASADSIITITAYIRPEGSTDDTGLTSDACKLEANITALDLVCNWLVPNNSYTSAPFDMTFSADIAGDEGALFTYDLNFGDGSTHYTGNGTVASGTTIELPYVPPQASPHTYTSLSSAISPSLTVTNTETGETSVCPTVLSGLVKPPVIVQPHTGSSSSSTIYLIILGVVSIAGGLYAYNTQVGALPISKLFDKKEIEKRKKKSYEKKILQNYEGKKK